MVRISVLYDLRPVTQTGSFVLGRSLSHFQMSLTLRLDSQSSSSPSRTVSASYFFHSFPLEHYYEDQKLRCHNLVWHSQLAPYVANLTGNAVKQAMLSHIQGVAGHFKDDCYAWYHPIPLVHLTYVIKSSS